MNQGPQTTSATLELDAASEAPTGALTDGHGQTRRFSGWIELAAAIEDWRTSTARAETSPSAIDPPDRRPPANTADRNPRKAMQ